MVGDGRGWSYRAWSRNYISDQDWGVAGRDRFLSNNYQIIHLKVVFSME